MLVAAVACGGGSPAPGGDDDVMEPDAGMTPVVPDAGPGAPDGGPPEPTACPAGPGGLACLFALWDAATASCEPEQVVALAGSLELRRGDFPAWHDGRALFASWDGPVAIAGSWNGWDATAAITTPVCGLDVHAVELAIASGSHEYKIVRDGAWSLDPESWAFGYDDFSGNPDGRNSVLNTYDSGVGHLVRPAEWMCSDELGNCRPFTTYLPAGYGAPANADRRYPVLYMHDGQNIFDDGTCCFGHGGWQINLTLDDEIAAGRVQPVVVVGLDHSANRTNEYGYAEVDGGAREAFMRFQVQEAQPAAEALWRVDPARRYVAGSSLGGLVSFALAFGYPDVYVGAASLSGSFWVGADSGTSIGAMLAEGGAVGVGLYLDHGGTAGAGGDNYESNVALRDELLAAGWSAGCAMASDALCYFHDDGATHDELAWRVRSYRFLRFLLAP